MTKAYWAARRKRPWVSLYSMVDGPPGDDGSPLQHVLAFLRVLESGGGAAGIRPFLADRFVLVEAPHLLAPEGSTLTLRDVLAGADTS
ncbi:hypothetical protein, partial [Escherichia coli]|uniref:hypothetical protein n=1 Tax=Escherichia coli TaxID=562 RepID=UPI0032E4A22A